MIIALIGVEREILDQQWTSAIAIAIAASYVVAAPLSAARYDIYERMAHRLSPLERDEVQPEDRLIEPEHTTIMVFGMGRIGAGAYDELVLRRGQVVLGVDRTETIVEDQAAQGRHVVRGDALDTEFWGRLQLDSKIKLIVLAMSDHRANLEAVQRVRQYLPEAQIAATASYSDDVIELEEAGVSVARNLYGEAGQGLADDACDLLFDAEAP